MTVWPKSAAGDSPGGDYHRRWQTQWLSIAMYHVEQQLLRPDLTAHELLKTTMALAKVTSAVSRSLFEIEPRHRIWSFPTGPRRFPRCSHRSQPGSKDGTPAWLNPSAVHSFSSLVVPQRGMRHLYVPWTYCFFAPFELHHKGPGQGRPS